MDSCVPDDAALFCFDPFDSNSNSNSNSNNDMNDMNDINDMNDMNIMTMNDMNNINSLPLLDLWDLACPSLPDSSTGHHDQDVLFPGPITASNFECINTHNATLVEQQSHFERLLDVSKALEGFMHREVSPRRSQQSPESVKTDMVILDAIGGVFQALGKLIACLECTPSGLLGPLGLDMCLRTRTTMLAVHCHVLSLKVMNRLAKTLLDDIRAYRQGHFEDSDASTTSPSPAGSASWESNVDKTRQQEQQSTTAGAYFSSSPHSDMAVNEAFALLDPLGHSLSSAIASLGAGISLLCHVQRALGISRERQSVAIAATAPVTPADGGGPGPGSGSGSGLPATSPPCAFVNPSSVHRFLTALWDEDDQDSSRNESGPGAGPDRTLHTLQVQYEEILRLFKEHFSNYGWHSLGGEPSV
ncbi:hypothetical protein E4U53_000403 [Claviceps sorghi]|nr:hypothetical protein E4U53_000403 [Claviceps sorghi]